MTFDHALLAAAVALALYVLGVLVLAVAGRGAYARAVVRFVPDSAVLFRRLLSDPRLPRTRKALLAGLLVYLASPIDLVPDFVPVAGALDDAILVVLVLRSILRAAPDGVLEGHWPGPPESLRVLARLVRA